jgi:hypothetical protein
LGRLTKAFPEAAEGVELRFYQVESRDLDEKT